MVNPPDEQPSFHIPVTQPIAARKAQPQPPTIQKILPGSSTSATTFTPGYCYSQWGTRKSPAGYGVQVGSYTTLEHAKDLCKNLADKRLETAFIAVENTDGNVLYRVMTGSFSERREATSYLKLLQKGGFDGYIKRHLSDN